MKNPFSSPQHVQNTLLEQGYFAEEGLSYAIYLSLGLERPLFLEGEPGVGKTSLAQVMSAVLKRPLVRLQCYYGIDLKSAVYDWNYAKQMVHIRLAEESERPESLATLEDDIYSAKYLVPRPLLTVLQTHPAPVLLVDEVDRTDEAFEALLLEFLDEFQISIPEIGTIVAREIPLVILTSNRTRDVHDALRRRCTYYWIDYPTPDRELAILRQRYPRLAQPLLEEVVEFVAYLRDSPLTKPPGLAESLQWVKALEQLGCTALSPQLIESTMGLLLKYYEDVEMFRKDDPLQKLTTWRAGSKS